MSIKKLFSAFAISALLTACGGSEKDNNTPQSSNPTRETLPRCQATWVHPQYKPVFAAQPIVMEFETMSRINNARIEIASDSTGGAFLLEENSSESRDSITFGQSDLFDMGLLAGYIYVFAMTPGSESGKIGIRATLDELDESGEATTCEVSVVVNSPCTPSSTNWCYTYTKQ